MFVAPHLARATCEGVWSEVKWGMQTRAGRTLFGAGRSRYDALRKGVVAAARGLSVAAVVLAAHGCGMEYEQCEGETQGCEMRVFDRDCTRGDGCLWGTQCAPLDCDSLTASQCTYPHCNLGSLEPCSWNEFGPGLSDCTATLTTNCLPPCGGVSQSQCASVPGCTWRAACTGHVIGQCSSISDESTCRRVYGCSWMKHSTGGVG